MSEYIKNINVDAFRGIRNLEIKHLGAINILVGDNNCGKTSLLELIKILSQPDDIGGIIKVALSRKSKTKPKDFIDTILTVFKREIPEEKDNKNMRDNYLIKASCLINNQELSLEIFAELSKQLNFSKEDLDEVDAILEGSLQVAKGTSKTIDRFSVDSESKINVDTTEMIYKSVFMPVGVNLYSSCVNLYPQIIKNEKKEIFIKVLKIFDEYISDISIVEEMIWIHHEKKPTMPLFSYGTGMQKALLMSIVLVMAKEGVLLIDEIETAIHTSALSDVFGFLIEACKEMQVQLFVTTHSSEALDKLLNCSANERSNIRVITLYQNEDKTVARVLNGEKAIEVKDELGLELR